MSVVVVFRVGGHRTTGAPDDQPEPLTVLINPILEPQGEEMAVDWEGCLSVPGMMGAVPRFTKLRYRGFSPDGEAIDRTVSGFHARVVQHECDHLDGVLYPMRMTDMASLAFGDVLQAEAKARGQVLELDEEGVPPE